MTREKMQSFVTMNEYMPYIYIEKERERGGRVVGDIGWFDGQIKWRERVFDDSNELIAYDAEFTPMTDADIERFAKKINRYIEDHTAQ